MSETRPAIPTELKREVRQACGFGCVVCGIPIYEIHHIIPFAEVQEHTFGNLVCLCPNHHRMNGWTTVQEITIAKSNPFNLRSGISTPYQMTMNGNACDIYIGNNHYSKVFSGLNNDVTYPWVIDDVPLITLKKKENKLLLSFSVYDHQGHLILDIIDNEIIFSIDVWDVIVVATRIMLKSKEKKKHIQILFLPESSEVIFEEGNFHFQGWIIIIGGKNISFSNKSTGFRKIIGGISIGQNPKEKFAIKVFDDPELPPINGYMIGDCPNFELKGSLFHAGNTQV